MQLNETRNHTFKNGAQRGTNCIKIVFRFHTNIKYFVERKLGSVAMREI